MRAATRLRLPRRGLDSLHVLVAPAGEALGCCFGNGDLRKGILSPGAPELQFLGGGASIVGCNFY